MSNAHDASELADAYPTGTIYNRGFWTAYAANVSLVSANALTFRFAEFVQFLGGTEAVAGRIVGTGMLAALAARLLLGPAIDNYGTRRLWTLGSMLFLLGAGLFLFSQQLSWMLYVGRTAFNIGLAAMFTCSIVHIQNQVPPGRRTEVIGNLGSSGFVGMIAGAQLGDWIFHAFPAGRPQFLALFGGMFVLGLVYFVLVRGLTRDDVHHPPHSTPPFHRLLGRYWPGNVVLVAIMMGVGLAVTTVFLTRFATHLGLKNAVGTFFTGYAVTAFAFRIQARNWSKTIGRHRMILLGLTGHCLGHAALPFVHTEWQFLIPAVACGFGHALLFPAVVSLGSGAFPRQYRGSGTTYVLGFIDLGTALSAPLLGWIIDYYDHAGFAQMFATSAGIALVIGAYYGVTTARRPDDDGGEPVEETPQLPGRRDHRTAVPVSKNGGPHVPGQRAPEVPAPTRHSLPAGRTGGERTRDFS